MLACRSWRRAGPAGAAGTGALALRAPLGNGGWTFGRRLEVFPPIGAIVVAGFFVDLHSCSDGVERDVGELC